MIFLTISLDGEVIPYTGMHIKRLPPKNKDFITLKPQQTVSATVDLTDGYDISDKGNYTILYKGLTLDSNITSLKKIGGAFLNIIEIRPKRSVSVNKRTPIINSSCNSTQVNQINQALGIAESIAITATNDLNNAPVAQRTSARRYREWFGVYSASRYEAVSSGMTKISDALINRQIGFDCTCDIEGRDGIFAFVFPNDPYNMNVCPVFFQTTTTGTDSRAGTIIHEISHFTIVVGSDDFNTAFDQSGSRALANSNPTNAIRNANAFEYFAENTPFLSMPVAPVVPEPEPEAKKPTIPPILELLLDGDVS